MTIRDDDAEPSESTVDPAFDARADPHPRGTVLRVAGDLDSMTVDRFTAAVAACAHDPRPLVLDLGAVTFLGSVGIAALIRTRDRRRAHDSDVRLVTGGSRVVLRPLEVAGLLTRFALHDTVEQALEAVSPPPHPPTD